jgi:trehalose utilization protein
MERWRQGDDAEAVWTVKPSHAIAQGVPPVFVIPREEMYAECVDIPEPDELVFISSFSGGEICRSGCCSHRGKGRIFYFRPGHEAHPTFHQPEVRRVVANATQWAYSPVLSPAIFDETWEVKQGEVGWFASA